MRIGGEPTIRPATVVDFPGWFALYDAVASEGRWIGGEPPSDREARRTGFMHFVESADAVTLLCESGARLIGVLGIEIRSGIADLGLMVDADWRGQGIGSLLMAEGVAWATEQGAHKIVLEVWPHNAAAIALYTKFGFVKEARLVRQYRRRNGELWDAIGMGLVLDTTSPGSPYGE